jgi:hypothetical protein
MIRKPTIFVALLVSMLACSAPPDDPPPGECVDIVFDGVKRGTQGFRVWKGHDLQSFDHHGKIICIPEEWEPVGEKEGGKGWAIFPSVQTGVIIRSAAFKSKTQRFANTPFEVEIVWPRKYKWRERDAMHAMIERSFEAVGPLYPRLPEELATPLTVLVTAGIVGDTRSYVNRLYPEPGPELAVVVRTPDQWRAHELFIHAVAHLYNRHRTYWLGEQEAKLPLPKADWEELVATWTETAFMPTHKGRMHRLSYVYSVHAAVRSGNFSRIKGPPFNDREAFKRIRQDVLVQPGAPNLDYQYGHYILAPLTMVATQGLLDKLADRGTIERTSVERLLIETHEGKHDSYFAALERILPAEEMERIRDWMHGRETIPIALVNKGAEHYRDTAD